MLNPINLRATTLSDAWYQIIYSVIDHGRKFKIDRGSFEGNYRYELDYFTCHITHPAGELLPKIPAHYNIPDPVDEDYVNNYVSYLMTGHIEPNEDYTYGERLCSRDGSCNQIEKIIETYKTKGHRNNQMILQVGQPTDINLVDPPCMRHIDTRIQDNKLHFFIYFRSWDLYSGLPANLAGIEMLKQYMSECIGVENGEMIISSKGGHIYDYSYELAKILRGK